MPCLVPIVEGKAEVESVPTLLRRLCEQVGAYPEIAKPVRCNRNQVVKPGELERKVEEAWTDRSGCAAILVVLDADKACPKYLAPALEARGRSAAGHRQVAVVLPRCEFEAWFLAAIESLRGIRGIREDAEPPQAPEEMRGAKEALEERMHPNCTYSDVADQPSLAAQFDLELARKRSRSFQKFEKEAVRLLQFVAQAADSAQS
jgi:hypothetical protein